MMRPEMMKRYALKRLALLIAALALIAADADAQLRPGVFAGLNYTALGDAEFGSRRAVYGSRSGFNVGVFVDMAAGPFAFRPGIGYVNTGPIFRGGLGDVAPDVDDTFELSYIFFPIDARLRLPVPFLVPYLHFGPELRFLSSTGEADASFRDNLRSFVAAGSIGAGAEVPLGGIRLMPEVRFAFDVSGVTPDTWEIRGVMFQADKEPRSRAFVIRLGAAF